jgi:ferric-dicitrate binding protein FerR (iron transport regulator)
VKLQGEAYFEVEKGKKFTVETTNGQVQVLGTRFLVSVQNNKLTVNCYEGKVQFSDKKQKQLVAAGNSLQYNTQALYELTSLDVEYPKIARFDRSFSNANLLEVIQDLEAFFNIRIQLENNDSKHFSGTVDSAEPETAIRIICRSLNLEYQFNSADEITIRESNKRANLTKQDIPMLMTE